MQETKIYEYFAFGYNYYLFHYPEVGDSVHGDFDALSSRIGYFLNQLEKLNLHVTAQASKKLRSLRERLDNMPKDSKVDKALADEVTKILEQIDATLDAELQLRSAFIVTQKRFQLDHLLSTPQSLFGHIVFENLPDICQFDFKEAGRCIAFGLPTSAAFHIMRGTEGVLRHYYCSIVKRERVKRFLWYDMVDHLRKRRDAPPKPLMDNLDNIRVNFRNPTQHPDARYDMDEAQDLLSISIDVVNRMIKDLAARKV